MKKAAYALLFTMLVFTTSFSAFAQKEETRSVSGFHSISSAGPFNVFVKIDGTESLKISADAEIIKEIETIVEDGNLRIKFKDRDYNHWRHDNMENAKIYITAKSLSSLSNAGSGNIKVDGNLDAEKVNVSLSGSGDMTSGVKSGRLHVSISGSGSVHLKGSTDETNVSIAGSGDLHGKGLKTSSATISIAGSGSAFLEVDKEVSANIVGSGNVVYSGNATVHSSTVGSGRVSRED